MPGGGLRATIGRRRPGAPPQEGRTVLVVDDGVATGATLQAALRVLRKAGSDRVVVAVPVAPSDSLEQPGEEADEVVRRLLEEAGSRPGPIDDSGRTDH